jgi:hypothetical protein
VKTAEWDFRTCPTENSVPINQHPCGTLIADLVDALSLLAGTSESKCWQSLPRPFVECIEVQGVLVAKESGFDPQKFGRVDQGEAAFPFQNPNFDATGLLRLSSEALVSVVYSPDLWNRYHAPLFRRFHCPELRGVFAQG